MSIYNPTNYRLIYEQNNGPIPVDSEGRTYDIHHIDGNRSNNDPSNLIALSIREHYDLHKKQEDWGACVSLSVRMKLSPQEISEMVSKQQKERVVNGTHIFQKEEHRRKTKEWNDSRVKDGTHPFLDKEWASGRTRKMFQTIDHPFTEGKLQKERVRNGTHPFLGGEIQRKNALKRIEEGTHNLLSLTEKLMKEGKHSCQKEHICPHCGYIGKGNSMFRWHFDNCKMKYEVME